MKKKKNEKKFKNLIKAGVIAAILMTVSIPIGTSNIEDLNNSNNNSALISYPDDAIIVGELTACSWPSVGYPNGGGDCGPCKEGGKSIGIDNDPSEEPKICDPKEIDEDLITAVVENSNSYDVAFEEGLGIATTSSNGFLIADLLRYDDLISVDYILSTSSYSSVELFQDSNCRGNPNCPVFCQIQPAW